MGKIGQIDTTSRKIFSARESSSNVQKRAFWKPLSNSYFKLLRTSINSHRSSMWILPAPPPVSGSILSAVPLCKNRGRMETLFKNFLINSVQHRLQRVLSSYGQRAFHLPLHIYMAKISDFGNTWGNFLPGRNSRCTFSQTPLTPTWEKSGKLTPPPEKFFQHVSHHLMSKNELSGNLFRIVISNCSARVSIVIDHPCEFCQHHLLSAGPYCPLSLYVKIEAEWKHFLKIFW